MATRSRPGRACGPAATFVPVVEDCEPASGVLPTISVVMPTFNRSMLLRAALEPLLTDPATLEVIVVDDGSTDDTERVLESIQATTDRLRWMSIDNAGAAHARQRGIEAADGDIVLIVDDDVIAQPGLVTGHARSHSGATGVVVVGYMPTELPASGSRGTFATTIYATSYRAHCEDWKLHPEAILRSLWMGNISLRRADAIRVGMSGSVTGYHADRDFGLRCEQAGLAAIFDPSLVASHRHRRGLRQFRADARSQGASAYAIFSAHGDVAGSTNVVPVGTGILNRLARAVGGHRLTAGPVGGLVAGAVWSAGCLRATTIELRGAYLLTRIEAARGYERARRELGEEHRLRGR